MSTLLNSIPTTALKLTLTSRTLIQTGVSSQLSVSLACLPVSLSVSLPSLHISPPHKPPVLLLGVLGMSPLSVVLSCGSPRELFAAPAGKVITFPCMGQLELGEGQKAGDGDPIPGEKPSPWQPPCPCFVLLGEHGKSLTLLSGLMLCLPASAMPGTFLASQKDSPVACDMMPLATVCAEEELVRGRERSQV